MVRSEIQLTVLPTHLFKQRLHVLEAKAGGSAAIGRREVEVEVRDGLCVADGAAVPTGESPADSQWKRLTLSVDNQTMLSKSCSANDSLLQQKHWSGEFWPFM